MIKEAIEEVEEINKLRNNNLNDFWYEFISQIRIDHYLLENSMLQLFLDMHKWESRELVIGLSLVQDAKLL